MSKWIETSHGNLILEKEDFYISYNADPGGGFSMLSGDENDETALCANDEFYILNGDHRQEYEGIVDQGVEACLDYYNKTQGKSSWSMDHKGPPKAIKDFINKVP